MSHYQVVGEKLVASGECLSRQSNGEIIFVHGLLPGESAQVNEVKRKGSVIFAQIESIDVVSKDRVIEPCPYVRAGCGGCDWQHINVEMQGVYKRNIVIDALTRIAKISDADSRVRDIVQLSHERYRTTARILAKSGLWGFHRFRSDEMVSVDDCLVLHPNCIEKAVEVCESISDINGIYEAQVRTEPDELFGHEIYVSPESFYQSHIHAPEALTKIISGYVNQRGSNLKCVDLFSGVGIIALALCIDGHRLSCVEGNRHAVADAKKNLEKFNVDIIQTDVRKYRYMSKERCDVVIADPAREGLGKAMIGAVLSCDADAVVLVSCDPASGARDIGLLIESGYELDVVTPVDMFGHTHHVEMVSLLTASP